MIALLAFIFFLVLGISLNPFFFIGCAVLLVAAAWSGD